MQINLERIRRAQSLMAQQGMIGLMIMTHDDYRYFFGELRAQPRAIIPVSGPPILIAFAAEEVELRQVLGDTPVRVFGHIGEQMSDVRKAFRTLAESDPPPEFVPPPDGRPRVGMQLWFNTPSFLVDLFRKLNPNIELVSSDPVMDELRMVKEPEEWERMRQAQEIAVLGMDRARELLRPGISGHEIATEVLYTMMKAGAEGTSTPIHINTGIRTCWIHGKADKRPTAQGDLVVVNLTPQVDGYCANLARTFLLGRPNDEQNRLFETYREMREATRTMLKPGAKCLELDAAGKKICQQAGLGDYHIDGISHGIGLRFEENPAPTIIKAHRRVPLREGMAVTVGHTILAIPGIGGVRMEDVYRVTPAGGEILVPYTVDDWVIDRAV
jgi:Xaa-Pro aminopeptidase